MARLGELGKIVTGNTPKTSEVENYSSNDICFVKPSDISENDITYIDNSEFYLAEAARDRARILPPKSILVTCIGIIGKIAINQIECAFNQQINAIIPNTGKCIPNYLAYAIQHKKSEIQNMANAAVVPIINKSQFSDIEINLTSLDNQLKIVTNLDKVSSLISLRKQQLAKLDELVKARFVEMFGDPVHNSKGLSTMQGQDFFKLSNGKFIPESKRFQTGIPAYGGNGISWYTDDVLYQEDTLVVGRVGFQSGNVHLAKGPLWITDNAMYISQYKSNEYDLTFLCSLMEHIDFTRYQDAGDLKKITQKPFMSMEYIHPPLSQQKEYSTFVDETSKQKLTIQQSLYKMEVLKKSLMQEYFG